MKWEIDFVELDEVIDDLAECEDFIDDFVINYKQLIESITTINEGEFFQAVSKVAIEDIKDLENVANQCADLKKKWKNTEMM